MPSFKSVQKIFALSLGAAFIAGCAMEDGPTLGEAGYISGFYGAAVSDEPRATIIARDILTSGGTAADAAVALGFSLAATMPTRAGLGANGQCMVHDADLGVTELLDFLPRGSTGGDLSLPTFARGMAALHARYGRFEWRGLLAPAEQLARLGHRPTRAAREELEAYWQVISRDDAARRMFSNIDGQPLQPTDRWQQVELSAVLGQLRARGAGAMYSGTLANAVIDAYQGLGSRLGYADLQNYAVAWRTPVSMALGDQTLYLPPAPATGGLIMGQVVAKAEADGFANGALTGEAMTRFAAAVGGAFAAYPDWSGAIPEEPSAQSALLEGEVIARIGPPRFNAPPQAYPGLLPVQRGSTGFVTVDNRGGAVACVLTLHQPLGIGRMPPSLGFYPAAPYGGVNWDSPAIIANENTYRLFMAIAGEGGVGGIGSMGQTVIRSFLAGQPLDQAIAEPRAVADPLTRKVLLEERGVETASDAIRSLGLKIQLGQALGRVNAVFCPSGLPASEERRACRADADSRSAGLAALSDQ